MYRFINELIVALIFCLLTIVAGVLAGFSAERSALVQAVYKLLTQGLLS